MRLSRKNLARRMRWHGHGPAFRPEDGPHRGTAGFSMMELVVVLLILAIMLSAVTPIFRDSLAGVRGQQAIRNLTATLKYGQERAVAGAAPYRFYFQEETGAFWLERMAPLDHPGDEPAFERLEAPYTREGVLPEGYAFNQSRARRDREANAHYVTLYPHGGCDYATLRIRRPDRRVVRIETKGRLGRLDVSEPRR